MEISKNFEKYAAETSNSGKREKKLLEIDFIANKYICEEYLIHAMSENGTIAFMTSTGGNGWEKEENKKYYIDAILASGWNATGEAIMKTGF